MTVLLVGGGIAVALGILFVLWCCLAAAGVADEQAERMAAYRAQATAEAEEIDEALAEFLEEMGELV